MQMIPESTRTRFVAGKHMERAEFLTPIFATHRPDRPITVRPLANSLTVLTVESQGRLGAQGNGMVFDATGVHMSVNLPIAEARQLRDALTEALAAADAVDSALSAALAAVDAVDSPESLHDTETRLAG